MAGKTKSKSKKRPLDMRSKMYLVLALCSVMLLVSIGVALALIGATFPKGIVKNAIMEFFGPGVAALSMDYRCGIDVMTTETACLSSVWCTDEITKAYMTTLGRGEEY